MSLMRELVRIVSRSFSVRYEISDSYRIDKLLASLWQFVKDSQH